MVKRETFSDLPSQSSSSQVIGFVFPQFEDHSLSSIAFSLPTNCSWGEQWEQFIHPYIHPYTSIFLNTYSVHGTMIESGYAETEVTVLDLKEQTFFSVLNLPSLLKLKCLTSLLIRSLLSASWSEKTIYVKILMADYMLCFLDNICS